MPAEFGGLQVSRVFESEAVGFTGSPTYNLVVVADTELPLATLCQRLRAMEFAHGREPDAKVRPRAWISICCSTASWSAGRRWLLPRGGILCQRLRALAAGGAGSTFRHPIDGRTIR